MSPDSTPIEAAGERRKPVWQETLRVLLLAMAAATIVISPMPFRGDASGHDFLFHLASWIDVGGQWREGILYPRWAEWANWGFGEPRFVFYPPISWISGAALGSVLPWKMVPSTLVWLTLVGAAMSMWRLAREWLRFPEAMAAAILYAVNPYHLVTVYYRSDFAELIAAALLPLLVWAALHVAGGRWRHVPVLAVVLAAIWLANAPAGVIATYSLALIIAVTCIRHRSARPAMAGGISMAAGFGLAAFYILPAAWEQRWVQIGLIVTDELHPAENFLFTHANDPEFVAFNWKVSGVALGLMLVTGIAAVLSGRRRKEYGEVWPVLAVLAAASALLMFPPAAILWRALPKLAFIQFPWRWSEVLGLAFAFFTAAALQRLRKRWAWWLALAAIFCGIAASGVAMARDAWWDTQGAPVLTSAVRAARGYEGTDEYMPNGCDRSELPGNPDSTTRAPDASATPAARIEQVDPDTDTIIPLRDARVRIERWTAERRTFEAKVTTPTTLALRLLDYPAWNVTVDGNEAHFDVRPYTTQLVLQLPEGSHHVEIRFRRTWDRTAGGTISLISAFALFGFAVFSRRENNPAR